jgi:hypothetical protein
MVNPTQLITDVNQVISNGNQVRFRYFDITYDSEDYDDEVNLVQSGNDIWCSGLIQPLDRKEGSQDSVLLQQGLIKQNDSKMYVAGSILVSGVFKIGIGSPADEEYTMTSGGNIVWSLGGSDIYQKLYIRYLPTGSLIGEE